MKSTWFFYISVALITACNQTEKSDKEVSLTPPPPAKPVATKTDEVNLLLSKVKWDGIYDSNNKIFIIGERHFQHNNSIAFIANLMLIFQKKGQRVVVYLEGLERNKTFTYTIQPGNIPLRCHGLEKKLRDFDGDQRHRHQEEGRAYRIMESGNYTSPLINEDYHAKNFVSELTRQGVDTSILKKHLYKIIRPLDNDMREIIRNAKQDEITILLCGVLHAVNLQTEVKKVNVIRFLYGRLLDDSTSKRSAMYRYLGR
jgi:hypothetical protein